MATAADVLQALESQQSQALSIISLSEPLTSALGEARVNRTSDASEASEAPTPASLEDDLAHYKVSRFLHVARSVAY
jgi:hypothetical protein